MKDYRIVTNNDVLKIIMKDKVIKLTLLDREGGDVASELLLEVYTPRTVEGYDIPQYIGEPDFHEIIDSYEFYDDATEVPMVIWGVKEAVVSAIGHADQVDIEDEEPEYQVCWYFDKGEL